MGQNLVEDYSFEDYLNCPNTITILSKTPPSSIIDTSPVSLKKWFTPNNQTPDYFNVCDSIDPNDYSYNNLYGVSYPKSGLGYAGLKMIMRQNNSTSDDYISRLREYISVQFTEPLEVGQLYSVSINISQADDIERYDSLKKRWYVYEKMLDINSIGFLFTKDFFYQNEYNLFDKDPQYETPQERKFNKKNGWEKINFLFTPDSAYEVLTFGVFRPTSFLDCDCDTAYKRCYSYYYFDDICIKSFSDDNPTETTFTDLGYCVYDTLTPRKEMDGYLWSNGDTSSSMVIEELGLADGSIIWLRSIKDCELFIDSFRIYKNPDGLLIDIDTTICGIEDGLFYLDILGENKIWYDSNYNKIETTPFVNFNQPHIYQFYFKLSDTCSPYFGRLNLEILPVLTIDLPEFIEKC